MGQGAEASETCADRPTEVSVIRFVSRNRTIEEIAPKKEVYICKQQGCGKVFTNQDEFKTHEILETLKIRFICKEPGCGEEVPDPGSMWRHYQEWHNHETDVFICPYTNCGSAHATSELLEEHIESSHRHLPTIPTEPEIICFEGPDNVIQENITAVSEDATRFNSSQNDIDENSNDGGLQIDEYSRSEPFCPKQINNEFCINEESKVVSTSSQQANNYHMGQSKLRAALCQENYYKNSDVVKFSTKFPKNKDLLITKENFYDTYESQTPTKVNNCTQIDNPCDKNNTVFISEDVSLTKTSTQEHRIELGDLERVFRHGLQQDSCQMQETALKIVKNNCQDDEEYTPKKQRMSRNKQDTLYKCQAVGCGKTYKSISHFKHHQDSHKIVSQVANTGSTKSPKPKIAFKTHTISFFICKFTGCGAEASNGNALWKHYQETHVKPLASKSNEVYRCMNTGCESEFPSSSALQKHISETHSKNSVEQKPNAKTGNGTGVLIENSFSKNTIILQGDLKTELETKNSSNLNEYQHNEFNTNRPTVGEQPGD